MTYNMSRSTRYHTGSALLYNFETNSCVPADAVRSVRMPEKLSAYEEERNRNILANQERLRELGLLDIVAAMTPQPQSRSKPRFVGTQKKRPLPTTRSDRARRAVLRPDRYDPTDRERGAQSGVDTDDDGDEDDDDDEEEEEEPLSALPFADNCDGLVVPQLAAGGVAFVKHMLPSHVTGGYWLQAPMGLGMALPKTDCQTRLRVGRSVWDVVYLARSSVNGGFSGGWRELSCIRLYAVKSMPAGTMCWPDFEPTRPNPCQLKTCAGMGLHELPSAA